MDVSMIEILLNSMEGYGRGWVVETPYIKTYCATIRKELSGTEHAEKAEKLLQTIEAQADGVQQAVLHIGECCKAIREEIQGGGSEG